MKIRFVFFALPVVLALNAMDVFGSARLEISETSFNFGLIPQVGKVSHTFIISSTGTDSLRILGVKPTCGCTKAPLEKDVIAPGDSTGVELIFTSSTAYRGTAQKSATVTCNDDERGTFLIRFQAEFNTHPDSARPLQLAPWNLEFPRGSQGKAADIIVTNVSDEPQTLTLVAFPRSHLNITMPSGQIKPGGSGKIQVKVSPECRESDFEKSFTIECSSAEKSRISIPVVMGKPSGSAAGH